MGGVAAARVLAMSPSPRNRIVALEQLNIEWQALGRSKDAMRALHRLADCDPELSRLVRGTGVDSPPCQTPLALIDFMQHATGRRGREGAAALVRVMLREAQVDPLITRFLVQALLPGLLSVASRLQWGHGGDWEDRDQFFNELLSTTWIVVHEWTGQDRPYAVLDLLSAIRCRLRRQLFRAKELHQSEGHLAPDTVETVTVPSETDLELLARTLIELRRSGMRAEEVEVLYAHHVLGYSIAELAVVTGRNRRLLYARRDRGQRRLCA